MAKPKRGGPRAGRESSKAPAPLARARAKVPTAERRSVEGWTRVPGPAKQYRNAETGETLSNRQYRQRFLYGSGKSLEAVAKARGTPRTAYKRLLNARQDYLKSKGIPASINEIRKSDAMKQIVRDLKHHKQKLHRKYSAADRKKLFGPDSELARALADLGYRDHDARHYVGDS